MFACQISPSAPMSPPSARSTCRTFHARIQSFSSGSPRSDGTPVRRLVASGQVAASVRATYQPSALSAVSGASRATRERKASGGTEEASGERRNVVVDVPELLRRREKDDAE